jgi:hypothetical protein
MSNIIMPTTEHHWRVYQVSIETSVRKGAATKYISEYLEAIGFTHTQISPTMLFERGSRFASLYNMNPKSQKTLVSVDFASAAGQTIVEMTMRVDCLGNKPLSKDYEFWAAELAGIEELLEHGYVNPYLSDLAAERAMWYNITITLLVLFSVIVMTLLSVAVLILMLSQGV